MNKKYTIAGENNPYWQLAEPVLLRIWAKGMLNASYSRLYLVVSLKFLVAIIFFVLGLLARALVLGAILFGGYLLFEQPLLSAIDSVFSTIDLGIIAESGVATDELWIYELAGYAILVLAILFLLGKNLGDFLKDAGIDLLVMATGMLPLMVIARGLQRGNFFAQLIAKSPIGSGYLPTTIAAAPDYEREWDKVFDLYINSNKEGPRKELESLAQSDFESGDDGI